MKTKTIKNQTPINSDVHFKYKCPSSDCNIVHWLSLKQTQTRNFKVVCDCGTVFQPKRIKTIKICYIKHKQKPEQSVDTVVTPTTKIIKDEVKISADILDKASSILCVYGFTKTEAEDMITKSYQGHPEKDVPLLVKQTLKTLEIKNG